MSYILTHSLGAQLFLWNACLYFGIGCPMLEIGVYVTHGWGVLVLGGVVCWWIPNCELDSNLTFCQITTYYVY